MRTAGHLALAGRPVGEGLPPKVSVLPVSGGLGRGRTSPGLSQCSGALSREALGFDRGPPVFAMALDRHGFLFAQKRAFVWA